MNWKFSLVLIIQLVVWIVTDSAIEASILTTHLFSFYILFEVLDYKEAARKAVESQKKEVDLR